MLLLVYFLIPFLQNGFNLELKKITSAKPKSVTKRMNQKVFPASVKRKNILECEKTGIPLEEFAELSVTVVPKINKILGL